MRVRKADERRGSGQRLEAVYREQGDRMWRAVLGFCGDPEVARDAVAEAFAQALRRGDEVRDVASWTWRTAFRVAAGEIKRGGRQVPFEREPAYELDEPAVDVLRALARLPRKERAAVVLHHVADWPVADVASIVGSTQAAVRMQLTRGRRRLRGLLERDG